MQNKRAVSAGFIATFLATIAIVLLLIIFVAGSYIYKKTTGVNEGTAVYNVNNDLKASEYMGSFKKFVEIKNLLNQGKSFSFSKKEAGYP